MDDFSDKTMDDRVIFRIFPEFLIRIDAALAEHPGRWENRSHFIRAATAHFLHYLETEPR